MKIYHGSTYIIDKPKYGLGKTNNDYGSGFYCTKEIELAKEWASKTNEDGYANEYRLDTKDLKILNLNDGNYNILHWLALLLKNRSFNLSHQTADIAKEYILNNFLIDSEKYDVIIGYRADDSYFSFAEDFLNNALTIEKLNYAMRLGNLGEQIVLVSKKAFKYIKYIKSYKVDKNIYYPKGQHRDKKARDDYSKSKNNLADGLFIMDIIRGGIKEDERLHI